MPADDRRIQDPPKRKRKKSAELTGN